MGQDPDELREAIEGTRRRMDETVLALEQKIDIRSRVRNRIRRLEWRRTVPYAVGVVAVTGGVVTGVVALKVRAGAPAARLASPVRRLPRAVPAKERTSTGLRPTRSDRRPHTGANTSWATEKDANRAPTVVALAWNRWA